jgi:hypothetical protein
MIGKAITPNERRGPTRTHTNLRGFVQPSFKSDSLRPAAGALKAGFGDEPPQLAFGKCASHQATEDSACEERAWLSGTVEALNEPFLPVPLIDRPDDPDAEVNNYAAHTAFEDARNILPPTKCLSLDHNPENRTAFHGNLKKIKKADQFAGQPFLKLRKKPHCLEFPFAAERKACREQG